MRIVWAPRAIVRATEIAEYIAADRPAAARRWVQGLFARAAKLRRHARLGPKVPELDRDEVRQVRYGKYRIVYRIDPKRVVVLTVRHSAREWDPGEVEPEE
jgi:plasmid stabilization system protein ParE